MREILFRGKRVDNGEWVEGELLHDMKGRPWIYWTTPKELPIFFLRSAIVKSETVGQFTGLKDPNGKRIFEGDIIAPTVLSNVPPCEVMFDVTEGQFIVEDGCGDCHGTLASLGRITDNHYKVVGNKWDNPELLED